MKILQKELTTKDLFELEITTHRLTAAHFYIYVRFAATQEVFFSRGKQTNI
jgi:hypothetical protein